MNIRKILAAVLCCVLFIAMQACFAEAPAAEIPRNYLKNYRNGVLGNNDYSTNDILTVTFFDTLANAPAGAWDVSEAQDGSVMAWIENDVNLFIAGEGGVSCRKCEELFMNYTSATSINFNGCFYTNYAEDFDSMFACCYQLESLDLSGFNTEKVENMVDMFNACSKLAEVNLSSFNTANVTDMSYMFAGCNALKAADLSSFDTSNVTTMEAMFANCSSVTSIDVSSFNTSKVKTFYTMFISCDQLAELNLSSFDFSAAEDMSYMFKHCGSLTDIGCTITVPSGAMHDEMYRNSGLEK